MAVCNKVIKSNYVDKEFQKMLLPLRCMNHLFFLSKFSLKYNCVRPNETWYNVVSLFGTLFFIGFHVYRFTKLNFLQYMHNKFVNYSFKFSSLVYILAMVIFYILNVIQSEKNVDMILKIQKVLRIVNYKNHGRFTRWNWIHFVRYFIVAGIIYYLFKPNLSFTIFIFTVIYFDVNIMYCIRIMHLFTMILRAWIKKVECFSKHCKDQNSKQRQRHCEKLFETYFELLRAFDIFKNLSQASVIFQITDTFINSLTYLQTSIDLNYMAEYKKNMSIVFAVEAFLVIWVLKNLLLCSRLSWCCDEFYKAIEDVDFLSALLQQNRGNSVEYKRFCKNIRRLNKTNFNKMKPYHLFTVDATLAQKLIRYIIDHGVVILQFAFL